MVFFFWFLALMSAGGEGVYCPHYCHCGMLNGFRNVRCVNKGLISVELDVPKTVEWLQLSHNYIYELRDNIFEELGLEHIIELNLDSNALQAVGLNAFAGLKKLQYVDLSRNHLHYLPLAAFEHNPNMIYLNLRGNPLRYFRSAFLISESISVLDISNCRLNYLTEASFMALPALTSLNISNNLIESLFSNMFTNLTDLHDLDMSNNKLECDGLMKELDSWFELKNVATIGSPCHVVIAVPNSGHMFERMVKFGGPEGDVKENESEDYSLSISGECICNNSGSGQNGATSEEIGENDSLDIGRKKSQSDYNTLFLILAFVNGFTIGVATTVSLWLCARWLRARASRRYQPTYNIIQCGTNAIHDEPPPPYSNLF